MSFDLWAVNVPGRKRKRTRIRKFLFVLDKPCDEGTTPQYYDTLKDWFIRHSLAPERTKALVFVFVFVFAHEQAISSCMYKEVFFILMSLPVPETIVQSYG